MFYKEFWERRAWEPAGKSPGNKKKAETKSKDKRVKTEETFVEETPSLEKIRITKTSMRRRTVSLGTSQAWLSSHILIDDTPQASPGDHNLSVLADAVAHTVGNE